MITKRSSARCRQATARKCHCNLESFTLAYQPLFEHALLKLGTKTALERAVEIEHTFC